MHGQQNIKINIFARYEIFAAEMMQIQLWWDIRLVDCNGRSENCIASVLKGRQPITMTQTTVVFDDHLGLFVIRLMRAGHFVCCAICLFVKLTEDAGQSARTQGSWFQNLWTGRRFRETFVTDCINSILAFISNVRRVDKYFKLNASKK